MYCLFEEWLQVAL